MEMGSFSRKVVCYLKDLKKLYLKSPSFFEWFLLVVSLFYTVVIPINSLPHDSCTQVNRTHCFSNLAGLCFHVPQVLV